MIEFAKGCDYAMYMVDELLDTITKGEHKKTVNVIEERKRVEEADARFKQEQDIFVRQLESQWENATKSTEPEFSGNLDSLRGLSDLGIDTSFVDACADTANPE